MAVTNEVRARRAELVKDIRFWGYQAECHKKSIRFWFKYRNTPGMFGSSGLRTWAYCRKAIRQDRKLLHICHERATCYALKLAETFK